MKVMEFFSIQGRCDLNNNILLFLKIGTLNVSVRIITTPFLWKDNSLAFEVCVIYLLDSVLLKIVAFIILFCYVEIVFYLGNTIFVYLFTINSSSRPRCNDGILFPRHVTYNSINILQNYIIEFCIIDIDIKFLCLLIAYGHQIV